MLARPTDTPGRLGPGMRMFLGFLRYAARLSAATAVLVLCTLPVAAQEEQPDGQTKEQTDDTYDQDTVLDAATNFFGETTEGLAEVIEKVFDDLGRPNGYIPGEEISGAFGFGVRYGDGTLNRKTEPPREVYWQGPSIGFDVGGNASKVFVLVYNLPDAEQLYQRFPGVEGTFYFVAGVGAHYLRTGGITLAPIRTGVGLRAGVNIGYMHMTKEHSWIPF